MVTIGEAAIGLMAYRLNQLGIEFDSEPTRRSKSINEKGNGYITIGFIDVGRVVIDVDVNIMNEPSPISLEDLSVMADTIGAEQTFYMLVGHGPDAHKLITNDEPWFSDWIEF